MTLSLNSSIASLRALAQMGTATSALQKSFQRLSSGRRINSAADDAAGLAVASSLNVNARIFGQAIRNVNDGVSLLNIAEGGLSQLSGILQRQLELASQAANGSYSANQRNALNREFQQLSDEYNRVIQTTNFNGLSVLSGSTSQVNIQAGRGTTNSYAVNVLNSTTTTTGTGTYHAGTAVNFGYTVGVGDFNGDGRDDVVTAYAEDDNDDSMFYASIYFADSQGNMVYQNQILFADFQFNGTSAFTYLSLQIGVGDINGDGLDDISFRAGARGTNISNFSTMDEYQSTTLVSLGNGNFGFSSFMNPLVTQTTAYGDFNADGALDIANAAGTTQIQNTTTTTSVESLLQSTLLISSVASARTTLDTLRTQFDTISNRLGNIGALQSRLSTGLNVLAANELGYRNAADRITSADMAEESARVVRNQILQQAAAGVLAQANQQPALALQLLRF